MWTWIFHPQNMDASYLSFVNRIGGKPQSFLHAVPHVFSNAPLPAKVLPQPRQQRTWETNLRARPTCYPACHFDRLHRATCCTLCQANHVGVWFELLATQATILVLEFASVWVYQLVVLVHAVAVDVEIAFFKELGWDVLGGASWRMTWSGIG